MDMLQKYFNDKDRDWMKIWTYPASAIKTIYKNDIDNKKLLISVPGVSKKELKIEIVKDELIIHIPEGVFTNKEKFTFELGDVDPESIKSKLENGILT